MGGESRAFNVPPESTGERLDVFLGAHVGTRSAAQRLIDDGVVTVDGTVRNKRYALTGGEEVAVGQSATSDRPIVPAEFEVRYEDEYLLVIDKPAGVVVHPGARSHREGTLVQALGDRVAGGDDPDRPGVVHRLDRHTSGLLIVARSEEAHKRLKAMMKARQVRREYLALVEGRPSARSGTIDAPIGRDRKVRTKMSIETDNPRSAVTHFEVEQVFPSSALLGVRLETGRTHQIRVHLAAIGHPVVGDPEYGQGAKFGLERQFLHARRLVFEHPFSGSEISISSELPADLRAALKHAAKPK